MPAMIFGDTQSWWRCGELHRDGDKPAVMEGYSYRIWYYNGKIHRDGDRPAVIERFRRVWYKKGLRHREGNLPAVVESNGNKQWFVTGECIRSE
jgi:hypothetical protein